MSFLGQQNELLRRQVLLLALDYVKFTIVPMPADIFFIGGVKFECNKTAFPCIMFVTSHDLIDPIFHKKKGKI